MNRSKEISEIVSDSKRILKKRCKWAKDYQSERELALASLLQKAVNLLFTHQDCVTLDLANNFANLSNDIVCDVIEFASYEEKKVTADFQKLALIDGSWAELGIKFATADRRLRKTVVVLDTDLDELKAAASQFYDQLELNHIPDEHYEILELLGTRFSSVDWWAGANLSAFASYAGNCFLKRQLKSKYLRKLAVTARAEQDMSALFVEFVKRPHFEKLVVGGENRLPFEVLEEAHKCWESQVAQISPIDSKQIRATISHETAIKIREHFSLSFNDERIQMKHPVHDNAKAYLRVYKVWPHQEHFDVNLIFDSLAEMRGCAETGYVSDYDDYDSNDNDNNDDVEG